MLRKSIVAYIVKTSRRNSFENVIKHHSTNIQSYKYTLSEDFVKFYPVVIQNILEEADPNVTRPSLYQHIEKSIFYNVVKKNQYLIFPVNGAYNQLTSLEDRTVDNIYLTTVLDWCLELVCIHLLRYVMLDDMMDSSQLRWNNPSWYSLKKTTTITDVKLMESASYKLLKQYFHNKHYYKLFLEMIKTACRMCIIGQSIDVSISNEFKRNRNVNIFTPEQQFASSFYKFSVFHSVPIRLAMQIGDISYLNLNTQMEDILKTLAKFSQAQNDILDCFACKAKYGKVENDITEGKLTWLIVTALQHANSTQLQLLKDNYGRDDEKSRMVKKIYEDLDILNKYVKFRNTVIEELQTRIEDIPFLPVKNVLQECIKFSVAQDQMI